jgi:hypothetical protein
MAKNRQTNDSRKKVKTSYVKNGVIVTVNGKPQTVYTEPRRILKEKYLTAKGKRVLAGELVNGKKLTKDEVWAKYGKNRYTINPNAKLLKTIIHIN